MMKKILLTISIMFSSLCVTVVSYAHPGNTDSDGGHYNRSTGEYHYHHGHPAHQHKGGDCPYDNWWIPIVVILLIIGCILLFYCIKNLIEDKKNACVKKTKKGLGLSDSEWEHLYKTNFEEFWEMVLKEVDFSKLPNSIGNFRTNEIIYGVKAKKMYLERLKGAVKPSTFGIDEKWISLLKIKRELEHSKQFSTMFDAIQEYHSHIVY